MQFICDPMIESEKTFDTMADIQSSETEISAPFLIWGLAEEFLSLNRPEECINLLLLLLEKISLAKTPMIEVKTRLRLGDILIRYTTEWKKAEIILMKANLILDEMNVSINLIC